MRSRCRGDGVDTLVAAMASRWRRLTKTPSPRCCKIRTPRHTRKSAASADVPILKRSFDALVTSWTSSWGETTLLKLSRDQILRNKAPNSRTRGVGSL